jgi:hypothetical protein
MTETSSEAGERCYQVTICAVQTFYVRQEDDDSVSYLQINFTHKNDFLPPYTNLTVPV